MILDKHFVTQTPMGDTCGIILKRIQPFENVIELEIGFFAETEQGGKEKRDC